MPQAGLFQSVDGADKSLAWVALAGLALAGLIIIMVGLLGLYIYMLDEVLSHTVFPK